MIRAADVRDAPAIADLKVRAWRAAYAGFVSRDLLDALDPAQEAGAWGDYLAAIPDTHRMWVADEDGPLLGFCRTGPAVDDADLGEHAAEIYGLYLTPDRIGTGLGRHLFGHAVADLDQRGYRPLCVYAYLPNDRAREFYQRAGFLPDGTVRRDEEDGTGVAELRLVRPASTG